MNPTVIHRGPASEPARARNPRARVVYADSEKNADMLYVSGVFVPDPFFFLGLRQKTYLLVNTMEVGRLRREAKVDRVFSYAEILASAGGQRRGRPRPLTPAVLCLALLGKMNVRHIEVPASFPLRLADELRNVGIQVQSVEDPFFPGRAVKNERERDLVRRAQRIAECGMRVAVEALKEARVLPGRARELRLGPERLTAERLRFLIHQAVLEKQGVAGHTIVACGRQGVDPHQRGSGILRLGQPIIIDVFPRSDASGYYGDITRTFVKGKASARLWTMYDAVRAGQELALSRIRPGIESSAIHRGILELFRSRGFRTEEETGRMVGFIHGTGHGVGLDLHEYPWIGERSCRLERGHVVTVEPGLYYPDVGGVRLEDVIWIDTEGVRNLTRFEKFLEIP